MTIVATVDLSELVDLNKQLLSAGNIVIEISEAQAQIAINLIRDGFDAETDPYGEAWKAKQRPNRYKILSGNTSLLRNSWHASQVTKRGWTVKAGVDYASYHQSPGQYRKITRRSTTRTAASSERSSRRRKIELVGLESNGRSDSNLMRPQRKMIPDRGLPKAWEEAFAEVAQARIRSHFGLGSSSSTQSRTKGGFKLTAGRSPITAKIAGMKRRLRLASLLRKVINATEGGN